MSGTESLLARADRWLSSNLTMESDGETRYALIRDLRNRVVELEAFYKAHTQASCTNPTCDCIEGRLARAEAQQSSLREKIKGCQCCGKPVSFCWACGEGLNECCDLRSDRLRAALLSDTETP